ncbi:hypothetical protein FNJ88_06260 [Chryseobacterium sp. SNU WT5]|uniref:hypothetical protein n=1 Tax=Chryseobacterium sp. SNU WT5 TaxID=2594269 RepID=UPI00117DD62F|nr:hypothetical protein [Chryseobacterium sp. SNU WT5]QDP85185.1 hypothetical protein FNJ88_06260 [Chryseobacterium sp. SNU WT5]
MNRIDFNQTGGFPLSTQILDAAQEAYKNFNQYGYLAGNDLVIITGCEVGAGGSVTNGFVSINGELLPFVGTTVTANVIIVETPDARGFEDGSVKPVIYARYATFGDGPDVFTWTDFRRPKTLFQLEDRLTQLEKAVPIGLVAVWGLPADAIPEGWVEHDDLKGNVPVGHNTGDVNFGALDAVIGTPQVALENTNLPPISVTIPVAPNPDSPGANMYGRGGSSGSSTFSIKTGVATPMTNIQPSRIVKFIRFVGFL